MLTREGLVDIVSLIEESRRIYQRSLTYALNVSVKKIEVPVLLTAGVLVWQDFVFSPLFMALLLVANDLVSMAIATDRVSFSRQPDRWDTRALLAAATAVAVPLLAISGAILWVGREVWPGVDLDHARTLVFLTLVLSSQMTTYLVRERGYAWRSRPGRWLMVASAADVAVVLALVLSGVLMDRLSTGVFAAVVASVLATAVLVDFLKVRAFRAVGLERA